MMCSVARNSRSASTFSSDGLVVHAVDQRHARPFQRLGRRDVGEDHELLDQPVGVEPLRRDDAVDRAVVA